MKMGMNAHDPTTVDRWLPHHCCAMLIAKEATTGTTPTRTKAGRKHATNGATALTPARRAATSIRNTCSRRRSSAIRDSTSASGAPVRIARVIAPATSSKGSWSCHTRQASRGFAPRASAESTRFRCTHMGPDVQEVTALTAPWIVAPELNAAARRSTVTGRIFVIASRSFARDRDCRCAETRGARIKSRPAANRLHGRGKAKRHIAEPAAANTRGLPWGTRDFIAGPMSRAARASGGGVSAQKIAKPNPTPATQDVIRSELPPRVRCAASTPVPSPSAGFRVPDKPIPEVWSAAMPGAEHPGASREPVQSREGRTAPEP